MCDNAKLSTGSRVHTEQNEQRSHQGLCPAILALPCEIPSSRAMTMHLGKMHLFLRLKIVLHPIYNKKNILIKMLQRLHRH